MENGGVLSKQQTSTIHTVSKRNWEVFALRRRENVWNWKTAGNSFAFFDENSLRLV